MSRHNHFRNQGSRQGPDLSHLKHNYLPGSASLYEELDKRVLVVMRGGDKYIGTLRSYDQFGNVILENWYERKIVGKEFGDKMDKGSFKVVRGDNMSFMGLYDIKKHNKIVKGKKMIKVSWEKICEIEKSSESLQKEKEKKEKEIVETVVEEEIEKKEEEIIENKEDEIIEKKEDEIPMKEKEGIEKGEDESATEKMEKNETKIKN